jgi:hypothetical protein
MEFGKHLRKHHQLASTLFIRKKYSRAMFVRDSKISKRVI